MFVSVNIKRLRRILILALAAACVIAASAGIAGGALLEAWNEASVGSGIPLSVIMYHSVLQNQSSANEYTVTAAQLESDLQYLKNNGYKTIVIDDLLKYVYGGQRLPEKPVMLTFDDGQLNNLKYAVPLLQKYKMKAVFSVVGAFVERAEREMDPSPAYAYMTWEDVRAAADSGVVEIQNHSYNLHGGKARMGFTKHAGETQAAFLDSLTADVLKMQRMLYDNTGITSSSFTYPYGLTFKDSALLLKSVGFKSAMTCAERVNIITADPECLLHINRFNRSGYTTTDRFMKKLGLE